MRTRGARAYGSSAQRARNARVSIREVRHYCLCRRKRQERGERERDRDQHVVLSCRCRVFLLDITGQELSIPGNRPVARTHAHKCVRHTLLHALRCLPRAAQHAAMSRAKNASCQRQRKARMRAHMPGGVAPCRARARYMRTCMHSSTHRYVTLLLPCARAARHARCMLRMLQRLYSFQEMQANTID